MVVVFYFVSYYFSSFYGFHRLCLTLEGAVEFVEAIPDFAGIRFQVVENHNKESNQTRIKLQFSSISTTTPTSTEGNDNSFIPAGHVVKMRASFLNLSDALSSSSSFGDRRRHSTIGSGGGAGASVSSGVPLINGDSGAVSSSLTVNVAASRNCDVFTTSGERNFVIDDICDPFAPVMKDMYVIGHHALASNDNCLRNDGYQSKEGDDQNQVDARIVFNCSWLEHPVEKDIDVRPVFLVSQTRYTIDDDSEQSEGASNVEGKTRSFIQHLVVKIADRGSTCRYRIRNPRLETVRKSATKSNDDDDDAGGELRGDVEIDCLNAGVDIFVDCDTEASFAWKITESYPKLMNADKGSNELRSNEQSSNEQSSNELSSNELSSKSVDKQLTFRFMADADAVDATTDVETGSQFPAFGGLLSVPLIMLF